jgi:PhoPQ-activated pathogenicity-related protein
MYICIREDTSSAEAFVDYMQAADKRPTLPYCISVSSKYSARTFAVTCETKRAHVSSMDRGIGDSDVTYAL